MNEGIFASITLLALRVLKYCSCRISSIIKLGFIGSEIRYSPPTRVGHWAWCRTKPLLTCERTRVLSLTLKRRSAIAQSHHSSCFMGAHFVGSKVRHLTTLISDNTKLDRRNRVCCLLCQKSWHAYRPVVDVVPETIDSAYIHGRIWWTKCDKHEVNAISRVLRGR